MGLSAPGNRSGQNRKAATDLRRGFESFAKITQNQILGAIFGDVD